MIHAKRTMRLAAAATLLSMASMALSHDYAAPPVALVQTVAVTLTDT